MIISLTFNKTELKQVLFPLMFYQGIFFLTLERRIKFAKAIYLMENNLNKLSDLPKSFNQIPYAKRKKKYIYLNYLLSVHLI
jgi:hypothetical protein